MSVFPLALVIAVSAITGTPSNPKTTLNLPTQIRSYLDKNYPGWRLSSVANGCVAEFKRALVAGDFDGDKRLDYAVKFITGRTGYIVAFLNRDTHYQPLILESGSVADMKNQGLTVARRGEKYAEIVNDNFDRVTRRLQHDAPVGGTCEASTYYYVYRNGSFKRAFVQD